MLSTLLEDRQPNESNDMYRAIIPFIIVFILSCSGPARFHCGNEYCGQDEWQKAINIIYLANFPKDKPYKGVLWEDDFLNAWVTTGNSINITAKMLYELETQESRVAVGAHEIAHLKQVHYYSNLGLAILANALIIVGEMYAPYSSQATNPIGRMGLAAFSRKHESEADRLAVQYLRKANYGKEDFLDLLYWMQDTLPDNGSNPLFRTHPHIIERINDIESLPDDPPMIMAMHD